MVLYPPNHLPYDHAPILRARFDAENSEIVYGSIPVAIAAIGDSLIEGWDFHAALPTVTGRVVNRGIGGDTAAGVAGRFAADVLQLRPQVALVMAGINDTWVLDSPPADATTAAMIEQQILGGFTLLAAHARAARQRLIICSLLPVNIVPPTPGSPTNALRNALIQRLNCQIERLANRYSCTFLDLHRHVVHADGCTLRQEISTDGIHLNEVGYGVLSAAVRPLIVSL